MGAVLAACGPEPTAFDAGLDAPSVDAPEGGVADTPSVPLDAPVDAPGLLIPGAALEGRLGSGEVARYPVELAAGDWFYLLAGRDVPIPDPTLALTTLAGDRVAYSEDFVQTDVGAILITRVPATASYVVEVALEPGREGDGRFTLESALLMSNASITFEVERGDDPASATPFESMFGWVAGSFEHPDDVDVFDLPDTYFAGSGTPTVGFDIMPSGPAGNGSTSAPARVRLLDAGGGVLGEWLPTGSEEHHELVAAELLGGFLEVRGGPTPGENGFYVVRIFVGRFAG